METTNLTINTIVNKMLENFSCSKRDDKTEYYHLKEEVEWQQNVIHKAHGDRMTDDDIYSRILTFLSNFSYLDKESTFDDYQDNVMEVEADIYTYDLTKWLNSRNDNVKYLTEALKEFQPKEGSNLLQIAQEIYIHEIGYALLNAINEYVEENQE